MTSDPELPGSSPNWGISPTWSLGSPQTCMAPLPTPGLCSMTPSRETLLADQPATAALGPMLSPPLFPDHSSPYDLQPQ